MVMPYQCLQRCGDVLLAASGSSIDSFSLLDGSHLSTWVCPRLETDKAGSDSREYEGLSLNAERANQLAPTPLSNMRRSLEPKIDMINESQPNYDRDPQSRSKAPLTGLKSPTITTLTVSTTGNHVIAVTAEDKSIRVFENIYNPNETCKHELRQMSRRAMPKRPCALAITPDGSTIISGDKFGDVYALPLLPSCEPVDDSIESSAPELSAIPDPVSKIGALSTAANTLTVHSQRNLRALENQRRQLKPIKSTHDTFEPKLLLGHVSMLTDIVLAAKSNRNYIITSDRDEHIRVSRGIPQAHIIDGYCLGHNEFVSRLCVPNTFPDLLVSGGGDDHLFLWNWEMQQLLFQIDLRRHVMAVRYGHQAQKEKSSESKHAEIVVSAIVHSSDITCDNIEDLIIVTCEGTPALFVFSLSPTRLQYKSTITLSGNAVAILPFRTPFDGARRGLIVSVDTIHQAGSTTKRRAPFEIRGKPLLFCSFHSTTTIPALDFQIPDKERDLKTNSNDQLTGLLYGFEKLRKGDDTQD